MTIATPSLNLVSLRFLFPEKDSFERDFADVAGVCAEKGIALLPDNRAVSVNFRKMGDASLPEQFCSLYLNPTSLSETRWDHTLNEAELDGFLEKWDSLDLQNGVADVGWYV